MRLRGIAIHWRVWTNGLPVYIFHNGKSRATGGVAGQPTNFPACLFMFRTVCVCFMLIKYDGSATWFLGSWANEKQWSRTYPPTCESSGRRTTRLRRWRCVFAYILLPFLFLFPISFVHFQYLLFPHFEYIWREWHRFQSHSQFIVGVWGQHELAGGTRVTHVTRDTTVSNVFKTFKIDIFQEVFHAFHARKISARKIN